MENISPNFLWQAAALLFAIIGVIAAAVSIWINLRGVPQPLRVQGETEFVSADDCERTHATDLEEHRRLHARIDAVETRHRAEMENLRLEIKSDIATGMNAGEQRGKDIHKRINILAEELPGKVVALLRNTGVIKT